MRGHYKRWFEPTPSQCPRALGDFLCIPTLNTGQLNPLFHTFAEFRLIVNRIVVQQSTDWLAANAQFSPNAIFILFTLQLTHNVLQVNFYTIM